PTLKDLARWLGEHSSFRAELVEFAGQAFKPAGKLSKADDKYTFESAVRGVRQAVEALGLKVSEEKVEEWPEYGRLGLKKYALLGEFPATGGLTFKVRDIETTRTRSKPS